ncbi:ABC transporter permease [Plantactinospora mayteni]|uniref:Nitrate ABC transporter permease n=1 Tax=Plantactinospora mayteni TaxID=566021 RepID=A0ABQ4F1C7_9ACTN|nr:ABC transporter permease [Plantactinospora mayteni]GIH00726.1 nitrate ABC transporter permease [Plantactinospora mayteni]
MATAVASPPTSAPPRTSEEERVRAARRRDRINAVAWRLAGYAFFLGLWEFASGRLMDERLLPGPVDVLRTFGELWASGKVPGAFADTLTRIGIGFAIAFVVGAAIGILMQNRLLNGFFRDAVTIGVTTPGLIWALITAIIFGNRPWGPLIAIVLTTFALISVNVAEGIKALPKDLIDMAKSFGVGVVRRNRQIVIPHLAPYIFTGVRFGFSIAWKVTVLTEVFSSSSGIGFEMRTASQLFRLPEFLTWILAFYVFALLLEKVVLEVIERRFFAWRDTIKS